MNNIKVKNNEWTFKNKEEIEWNHKSAIVCQNSFGALMEIEDLEDEDNEIGFNQEVIEKKVIKEKTIMNVMKELEMKEELYEVEIITTKALEAMLDILVLKYMKE